MFHIHKWLSVTLPDHSCLIRYCFQLNRFGVKNLFVIFRDSGPLLHFYQWNYTFKLLVSVRWRLKASTIKSVVLLLSFYAVPISRFASLEFARWIEVGSGRRLVNFFWCFNTHWFRWSLKVTCVVRASLWICWIIFVLLNSIRSIIVLNLLLLSYWFSKTFQLRKLRNSTLVKRLHTIKSLITNSFLIIS